jgi:hypothetical protein
MNKRMKDNVNNLHAQRSFWEKNSKHALRHHFIVLMLTKKLIVLQIMRYILCHKNPILNLNPKIQVRKCRNPNFGLAAKGKKVTRAQA